jgi:hypothetical protein
MYILIFLLFFSLFINIFLGLNSLEKQKSYKEYKKEMEAKAIKDIFVEDKDVFYKITNLETFINYNNSNFWLYNDLDQIILEGTCSKTNKVFRKKYKFDIYGEQVVQRLCNEITSLKRKAENEHGKNGRTSSRTRGTKTKRTTS